jgi:hypothetical protein
LELVKALDVKKVVLQDLQASRDQLKADDLYFRKFQVDGKVQLDLANEGGQAEMALRLQDQERMESILLFNKNRALLLKQSTSSFVSNVLIK